MELLTEGQAGGQTAGHDCRTVLELTAGPNGTYPPDRSAGWLPLSEAAELMGTTARTLRRRVASGQVESIVVGQPGAQVRWVRIDDRRMTAGQPADTTGGRPQDMTHGQPAVTSAGQAADTSGGQLAAIQAERDLLKEERDHLRAQLAHRVEEVQRRDQAEAELRRLLLSSQQALQLALEQRSLPPAPEAPRRLRWWQLWR